MIQDFLFKLHAATSGWDPSPISVLAPPLPVMASIEQSSTPFCGTTTNPCRVVDCEWTNHMLLFYPTYDIFRLPVASDMGACVICDKVGKGEVTLDRIKLVGQSKVVII